MKGHVAERRWKTKAGRKTGWYVVIDIGRDLDGKRRQKWHGGFATRAEAEAGRIALLAELDAGTYTEPRWAHPTHAAECPRNHPASSPRCLRYGANRPHSPECVGARSLRWDDIDFINQRVYIRQSRGRIGTEMVITTPKFGNGRLIDLDTETTRRFSDHQQRQDLASRTLGVVNPDRFVLLAADFNPARPDYLAERFLLISSHLGLPRIRFHDLRHTYATIVLAADVSIHVVSQCLGHLNNSVTLNVYSHVMPGMQANVAQPIADYITGADQNSQESQAAAKLTRHSRHGPWNHLLQHRRPRSQ